MYTVLLGDDHQLSLSMMEELIRLVLPQARTLLAYDGEETYQMAVAHAPELVITDWMMPRLTGLQLIERMRETAVTAHIPIILVTGASNKFEVLETVHAHPRVSYVWKPFKAAELRDAVEDVLYGRAEPRINYAWRWHLESNTLNVEPEFWIQLGYQIGESSPWKKFSRLILNEDQDLVSKLIHQSETVGFRTVKCRIRNSQHAYVGIRIEVQGLDHDPSGFLESVRGVFSFIG